MSDVTYLDVVTRKGNFTCADDVTYEREVTPGLQYYNSIYAAFTHKLVLETTHMIWSLSSVTMVLLLADLTVNKH